MDGVQVSDGHVRGKRLRKLADVFTCLADQFPLGFPLKRKSCAAPKGGQNLEAYVQKILVSNVYLVLATRELFVMVSDASLRSSIS